MALRARWSVFFPTPACHGRARTWIFQHRLSPTLTLLGLIIGFTFSMAAARYDLRKHYEEEEANAIGTEYARVQLLPMTTVPQVRELLKKYLELRIAFYESFGWRSGASHELADINIRTQELQLQMWHTRLRFG